MIQVLSDNPAVVFAVAMATSMLIFLFLRLLLNLLYKTALVRFSFFRRHVKKLRARGLPIMARYGLIGLVAFAAVPFPGSGVYGATILSWLLGIKWQLSLAAILPGVAISNGIVILSMFSIAQGINQTG